MSNWHPLPLGTLSFVEQTPGTVLLHSSRPAGSGVSHLFTSPLEIIQARNLADLSGLFSKVDRAVASGHVAAGYFGYESAMSFEPAAAVRPHRESDLLAWLAIYDQHYTFDHRVGAFDRDPPLPHLTRNEEEKNNKHQQTSPDFTLDQDEFTKRIQRIHDYIRSGDVYQLNFTFPLRTSFAESPAELYARLSAAQPVEYGAFLHSEPGRYVLSFSPELFFRIDCGRHINTRPMKGTAPRGRSTTEDARTALWLANDAKNRAENVMIVDLIRNDLGKICEFGSVKVENLFAVERYPSLWQMTSSISGRLRSAVSCEEVFRALFPSGSITGAPKVRAMQLLAQLEDEPRGVYTGAIGYFSGEQTVFNVAIRTLEVEKGTASMGVGAGIVIDSGPEAEYHECQLKAEFLTRSAEPFSLIETTLWNGIFPLLEMHLDRLADSASYFDFHCDRASVRNALLKEASLFSDDQARRVRLLLSSNGKFHIESTVFPEVDGTPAHACIASQRTDPSDRFLFHKTTRRALYNETYTAARTSGFADVLFLNARGEVTEGSVHNIFVEKFGRWFTPPLECGVLPGVYRRHLLETRPDIEEQVLTLNDLKAADSVYICNAVRGLRRVIIDFDSRI